VYIRVCSRFQNSSQLIRWILMKSFWPLPVFALILAAMAVMSLLVKQGHAVAEIDATTGATRIVPSKPVVTDANRAPKIPSTALPQATTGTPITETEPELLSVDILREQRPSGSGTWNDGYALHSRRVSVNELKEEICNHADASRLGKESSNAVLIRADAKADWGSVVEIEKMCVDANLGKIRYAVYNPEKTTEEFFELSYLEFVSLIHPEKGEFDSQSLSIGLMGSQDFPEYCDETKNLNQNGKERFCAYLIDHTKVVKTFNSINVILSNMTKEIGISIYAVKPGGESNISFSEIIRLADASRKNGIWYIHFNRPDTEVQLPEPE
jgi:biopolymer transport protein ExbD